MNRLFYSLIILLASCAVMVGCCVSLDEPQPPTPDEPQPPINEEAPFEVEIVEITRASLRFNVIPANLDGEYLCIVEEKSVVEEFTRDEHLVSTILQELQEEANAVGKTLAEYLPTITDKGILEDAKFSGLAIDTEYYLIIIGVDPANNYAATEDLLKTIPHPRSRGYGVHLRCQHHGCQQQRNLQRVAIGQGSLLVSYDPLGFRLRLLRNLGDRCTDERILALHGVYLTRYQLFAWRRLQRRPDYCHPLPHGRLGAYGIRS